MTTTLDWQTMTPAQRGAVTSLVDALGDAHDVCVPSTDVAHLVQRTLDRRSGTGHVIDATPVFAVSPSGEVDIKHRVLNSGVPYTLYYYDTDTDDGDYAYENSAFLIMTKVVDAINQIDKDPEVVAEFKGMAEEDVYEVWQRGIAYGLAVPVTNKSAARSE